MFRTEFSAEICSLFWSCLTTFSVDWLQLLLAFLRSIMKCANFLPLEEWVCSLLLRDNPLLSIVSKHPLKHQSYVLNHVGDRDLRIQGEIS